MVQLKVAVGGTRNANGTHTDTLTLRVSDLQLQSMS